MITYDGTSIQVSDTRHKYETLQNEFAEWLDMCDETE